MSVRTDSPSSLRPSVGLCVRLFMVNFNIGLLKKKKKKKAMKPEICHFACGNIEIFPTFQIFCLRVYMHTPPLVHSSCRSGVACELLRSSLSLCSWQVQPTGKVPGEGSNQPERSLGKGPEEARIPVLQARGFGSGLTTRN